MVTGEAGSGKTLVLSRIAQVLEAQVVSDGSYRLWGEQLVKLVVPRL